MANETDKNVCEGSSDGKPTVSRRSLYAAAALYAACAAIFIPASFFANAEFILLSVALFIAACGFLVHYLRKRSAAKGRKPKSMMPYAALGLDLAAVPCALLGALTLFSAPAALILFLFAIVAPICGIGTGIAALSSGKEKIGRTGIAVSVIAIALPILFVLVMAVLFGTGVAVIRLM